MNAKPEAPLQTLDSAVGIEEATHPLIATSSPAVPDDLFSIAALEASALRAQQRRGALVVSLRIAILVVFIGVWEGAGRFGWIDPFFFGLPSGIARQIYEWITEGTSQGPLWVQVLVTFEETAIGFAIGAAAGVVCGIALGRNRFLADVFSIYIKVANSIPRVVLGSIFIISLGLGMASKVALAVVMVFFVVFANAFQGVREADRAMIANAEILGASRWQVTTTVVIPAAMSWILASLHVSFGFALVGAVVGEFLGSRQGVGLLISTAQGAFNANGVFAAMIILAVMALAAEYALTLLENRLVRWRPPALSDI
jgi:NitT/TauT family transport system permease protein